MCQMCQDKESLYSEILIDEYDLGVAGKINAIMAMEITDADAAIVLCGIHSCGQGKDLGETKIKIRYCPLCGRKLC